MHDSSHDSVPFGAIIFAFAFSLRSSNCVALFHMVRDEWFVAMNEEANEEVSGEVERAVHT